MAAILLVAAACGDADTAVTTPSTTTTTTPPTTTTIVPFDLPTDPEDVVLRMMTGVNFPDPLPILAALPEFTLYGDGRLIVADPERRWDPLPGLVEARLTREGMQRLVARAAELGALEPLDRYGFTNVADGDSTRFFIDTGAAQVEFGVYDLGGGADDGSSLTEEQLDARRRLVELRNDLRNFQAIVGDAFEGEAKPFEPDAVAVFGIARGGAGTVDFPFNLAVTGERFDTRVTPVDCQVVTGADLDQLVALVADAERGTEWRIDGVAWDLEFRPLLPDEPGCAQLAEQ